jgi:hypothetical protein
MERSDRKDRPSKKRRLSITSTTFDINSDYAGESSTIAEENSHVFALTHEFNLEIAIRQRLIEAAQARIKWANILIESLKADENAGERRLRTFCQVPIQYIAESAGGSSSGLSSSDYKNIALQTLNTVHTSIDSIVSHESPLEPAHVSHPHRRDVKAGSHVRPLYPPPTKPKVLYLCDEFSGNYVKMACTDCGRSDFTSLQGLLNHCRLSHKREYGGHDECMQHCAVPVAMEDVPWLMANGHQLSGVSLPSLGRLFKTAVGAELPGHSFVATPTIPEIITNAESTNKAEKQVPPSENTLVATHLTKTLGLHKDSPALAPFLGRTAKPRVIHCYGADNLVDILTVPLTKRHNEKRWTMSFSKRSAPKQEFDMVLPPPANGADLSESNVFNRPAPIKSEEGDASRHQGGSSRFHIVSRIHVVDKSIWIPPGKLLVIRRFRFLCSFHVP